MEAVNRIHKFDKFGSILGLERISSLMEKLGNPQEKLKIIHVAGTNGKGSVSRFLYESLEAAGYKVGLYTSPFIEVFNERIELDHSLISDEDLDEYSRRVIEKTEELVAEGKDSPTEFDVVTAIAFTYFAEKQADYVVLEVGLGGRGDSTNVIKNPMACVFTSISFDHMDRLGDTIEKIAWEKAGILKAGCPAICGVRNQSAFEVIEKESAAINAPFIDGRKMAVRDLKETTEKTQFVTDFLGEETEIELSMIGDYQVTNAVTALATLEYLISNDLVEITRNQVIKGFSMAKQHGRFEVMSENPYVVIDGAHNSDGARALADTSKKLFAGKKVLMVTGILADKDVDGILDNFLEITKDFIVTEPDNPRKLDKEKLAKIIMDKGGRCKTAATPEESIEMAAKQDDYDVILYAGSLYLIGRIRTVLGNGKEN